MESLEMPDKSLKELPTREQKLRRNKDRRESPALGHVRPRSKGCTSPLHDAEMEKNLSDRSVSSSPEGLSLHLSPNSAFTFYSKLAPVLLPSPVVVPECTNSYSDLSNHSAENEPDFDQPLDMSTKQSPHNTSSHSQQQRPSVITCASALLRTHCNIAPRVCSVSLADHCTVPSDESRHYSSDNSSDSMRHEDTRTGHRREVASGSCDPVIDEHFRRSLGKDYQEIFSKSSPNSVSITVDDHFAKALGDTWLQLQQSNVVAADSPQAQTQSLHSKQQSHFLKHSPEIVSS